MNSPINTPVMVLFQNVKLSVTSRSSLKKTASYFSHYFTILSQLDVMIRYLKNKRN